MDLTALKTSLHMAAELYGISSAVLDTPEAQNRFFASSAESSLQHFFSAEKFSELTALCRDDNCLHIIDELQIHHMLLCIGSIPVVLGPFVTRIQSRLECHHMLSGTKYRGISVSTIQTLRSTVPNLSEQTVLRILHAVLCVSDPLTESRKVIEIGGHTYDTGIKDYESEHYQENYGGLIQNRYQIEQHFMNNLMEGNAHAAIHNFHNMHQSVAYLKQTDQLQRERIGAAIVRTMIRIAAFQAGLPALTIDLLSGQHTIAVFQSSSTGEIIQHTQKTIRQFCDAIREKQTSGCSNLVLSAKEYLDYFYTQDISLQMLCDELNVSPNHLISVFRIEIGATPMHYLRKIRLEHACRFLIGTDLQISQISSLVGISDSNYFSRVFRKTFGKTPAEYRKQYRI
ncbi:MAG TPA: helix-turn-helix transcriptional regulator [Candidatus Blautia stercoravium]|nr:helix-turn-helix transcriptional regulator [Candidatus Blautia stercoravium]